MEPVKGIDYNTVDRNIQAQIDENVPLKKQKSPEKI